jgi:uncharacterized protein (DUF1778 family)
LTPDDLAESAETPTRLQVRVSREQLELFKAAARADNRSLANWIRDRLEFAAEDELLDQEAPDDDPHVCRYTDIDHPVPTPEETLADLGDVINRGYDATT